MMKKTLFWTCVSGLLYAAVSFFLPLCTTWILDQDHAGVISAALLISTQLLTVGLFSVRTFQVSDQKNTYQFTDYYTFRIVSSLFMMVFGALWIIVSGYQKEKAIVIFLLVIYKWIESFSDLFEGEYQKTGVFFIAGRMMTAQYLMNLCVYGVTLFISRDLVFSCAMMDICFFIMVFFVNVLVMKKHLRIYIPSFSKKLYSLFVMCLPAFLNAFLLMYLDNCAKFSIEKRNDDAIYYEFATLFMSVFVINLFASFFLKTFLKTSADFYFEKKIDALVKLMKKQALLVMGLTFLCLLGGQAIGLLLLSKIYHCDLMGYRIELTILLIAGGINAINSMLLNMLVIMRKQKLCLILTGICAGITYFLLPVFLTGGNQFLGAGLGYLLAVSCLFILYAFAVYKNLKKSN